MSSVVVKLRAVPLLVGSPTSDARSCNGAGNASGGPGIGEFLKFSKTSRQLETSTNLMYRCVYVYKCVYIYIYMYSTISVYP